MDQTNYVSDPVPGFKDAVGQTVVEGDWVVLAVNNSGGLRLARVLAVEPEVQNRVVRWDLKPEAEWTEWERRYEGTRKPQVAVYEEYVRAKITVTQYASMNPKQKPVRREATHYDMIKFTGPIPYDLS